MRTHQSIFDGKWYERRWSMTWELAARISDVKQQMRVRHYTAITHLSPEITWYVEGFMQFQSPILLVDRMLRACKPVRFSHSHDVPFTPFDTIRLDAFDFISGHMPSGPVDDDVAIHDGGISMLEKFSLATYPVDNKLTCAFHVQCTL
jgi:hypothetical protein